MKQRINANMDHKSAPVVDLAENAMPHPAQIPPGTLVRKLSSDSTDSFDFPEIDRMVNRIGGRRRTHEATTEHPMR